MKGESILKVLTEGKLKEIGFTLQDWSENQIYFNMSIKVWQGQSK